MHKIWQVKVAANFPSNPFADMPRRTAQQKILHLATLHCTMGIAHDRRAAKVAVWVRPNTHLSSIWAHSRARSSAVLGVVVEWSRCLGDICSPSVPLNTKCSVVS